MKQFIATEKKKLTNQGGILVYLLGPHIEDMMGL